MLAKSPWRPAYSCDALLMIAWGRRSKRGRPRALTQINPRPRDRNLRLTPRHCRWWPAAGWRSFRGVLCLFGEASVGVLLPRAGPRPQPLADGLERDIERRDRKDADESRKDHPAKDGAADVAPRQLRRARRDDERVEAEDERKRRHHDRAEAITRPIYRRLPQWCALFPLCLGELDNQDAVFCREADQHDHANLRVEIERQATKDHRSYRAQDPDHHRQKDRYRYGPAFVKRHQEQIGEQDRKAE